MKQMRAYQSQSSVTVGLVAVAVSAGDFRLGEDLAARHGQAGGVGAQHGDDLLVHEGLRGQRRLGAVGLVVAVDQLDLLAEHLGVQLVRQIEAFLFHRAARGGRTGHRLKDAELDSALREGENGAEQARGQQQSHKLFHDIFPPEQWIVKQYFTILQYYNGMEWKMQDKNEFFCQRKFRIYEIESDIQLQMKDGGRLFS